MTIVRFVSCRDSRARVDSIQTGELLSALANPNLAFVPNLLFGKATATFPGREIQLGFGFPSGIAIEPQHGTAAAAPTFVRGPRWV